MSEKRVKNYSLCLERVRTIKDIKKILEVLDLVIADDHPKFDKVSYYFSNERLTKEEVDALPTLPPEEAEFWKNFTPQDDVKNEEKED